jgi:hypothetical protein
MAKAKESHQRLINIPLGVYADLQLIASIESVSVAAVIRDALAHYTRHVLGKRGAA